MRPWQEPAEPGGLVLFKRDDYVFYSRPGAPVSDEEVFSPAGPGGLLLEVATGEPPRGAEDPDVFYRVLSFTGAVGWIESWAVEPEEGQSLLRK